MKLVLVLNYKSSFYLLPVALLATEEVFRRTPDYMTSLHDLKNIPPADVADGRQEHLVLFATGYKEL